VGYLAMTYTTIPSECQSPVRDREVIRVDLNSDKMGIASALRQAFSTVSKDETDRYFDHLLDDLP
jgi:hypothetical protein